MRTDDRADALQERGELRSSRASSKRIYGGSQPIHQGSASPETDRSGLTDL